MSDEFDNNHRLIAALSFEESPIYTEMINEIRRHAMIEMGDAISVEKQGEARAHSAGRAQALFDLIDAFEDLREQIKERMMRQ